MTSYISEFAHALSSSFHSSPDMAFQSTLFLQNGKNKLAVRKVCQWENLFNLAHRNVSFLRVDTQRPAHVNVWTAHLLEVFVKPL